MKPVSLYETCPKCDGHGRVSPTSDAPRSELCPRCEGKGRVPTDDGAGIVELLKLTGLIDMAPEE